MDPTRGRSDRDGDLGRRATRGRRVRLGSAIAVVALVLAAIAPASVAAAGQPLRRATADDAPLRVAGTYPTACLAAAPRADTPGLVASVANGRVAIAAPTGGPAVTLSGTLTPEQSSVGWSVDGRYLAAGDGRFWTRSGRAAGKLFGRLSGPWAWSPSADCAVGITFGAAGDVATLSVGEPGAHSHPLVRGTVADFTFTPNGRALILVALTGGAGDFTASFWRLDLASGELRSLARLSPGTCCVNLGGFAPGGRLLWFWGGPGGSVKADGWPLAAVDVVTGGTVSYGVPGHATQTLPRGDFVTACGGRVLASAGTSRNSTRVFDKRLAFIAPGRLPLYLTPPQRVYESPACSPSGKLIAAPQGTNGGPFDRLRLALLTTSGTFVRYLDAGGAFGDYLPEWGATGILFERLPDNATETQLWFIPSGRSARSMPLYADGGPDTFDWSTTRPTGQASFSAF